MWCSSSCLALKNTCCFSTLLLDMSLKKVYLHKGWNIFWPVGAGLPWEYPTLLGLFFIFLFREYFLSRKVDGIVFFWCQLSSCFQRVFRCSSWSTVVFGWSSSRLLGCSCLWWGKGCSISHHEGLTHLLWFFFFYGSYGGGILSYRGGDFLYGDFFF